LRPATEPLAVLVALGCLVPGALAAQHDLEFHIGRWAGGNAARVYEFREGRPLAGPFRHGVTIVATVHEDLGRRRAFYGAGYDLMAFRPARGLGAYGLLGLALGLSTDTTPQKLGAQWSFGGGLEWRPFGFAALGVEARYRVEDRGPRGFWATAGDRSGLSWSAGLSVRLSGGGRRASTSSASPTSPTSLPALSASVVTGAAAGVVRLAVDALGTPYRWGGTADNGFDCSGLVQWAYGQYGVALPRTSRAQAQAGAAIPPVVDALAPGDILLFAARRGGGVTHVGMYVGDRTFIHSSSSGVRLSRLEYGDVNGAYWLERWVGARRVV
jgi:cell wall-associated NlpC family hydrolase